MHDLEGRETTVITPSLYNLAFIFDESNVYKILDE